MSDSRIGQQTPTNSYIIPYKKTLGSEAIELYNNTTRNAMEWQEIQMMDIMAVDDEGQWLHMKYGYSIPRRNGKSEILVMRELWGIIRGERILHTAHRTTTSHASWEKLKQMLDENGFEEIKRADKSKKYEKAYTATAQYGLETIRILGENGGTINFRTRSSKGGLGEGFDLLVIDEAQEYTDDQQSALQYVVTSSENPQTIMCGTPPTAVSSGTVFEKLRESCLSGKSENCGWAEWSVEHMSDVSDRDIWYKCNPSLGQTLKERSVAVEDSSDEIDFNIQRFGLWLKYNQKSAILEKEWDRLGIDYIPNLTGKLYVGIKYSRDGESVCLAVACLTEDKRILVDVVDRKTVKDGSGWIIDFLKQADVKRIVVDGANGQAVLKENLRDADISVPITLPKVADVIEANAYFEKSINDGSLCHFGQPSLKQSATNSEKRAIGTNGGFGYKSILNDVDITLLDSVILANWLCNKFKNKKKQKIFY